MLKKIVSFQWQGVDASGMRITGIDISENLKNLIQMLQQKNIILISYKKNILFKKSQTALSIHQLQPLLAELACLLTNGISLHQSLQLLNKSYQHNLTIKLFLQTTQNHLSQGYGFAEALKKQNIFDTLTIAIITAGETSNTLDKTLTELSQYQERIVNIRAKLFRVLSYPSMVMLISLIIIIMLLLLVIPQFESIFNDFGSKISTTTKILFDLSHLIKDHFLEMLISFMISILFAVYSYRKHKLYRQWIKKLIKQLPLIKTIILNGMFARWAQMTATALQAGITVHQALEITHPCLESITHQNCLQLIIKNIKAGQSLQSALFHSHLFPERIIELIAIGESSGNMSIVFNQIAKMYQEKFDDLIEMINKWLEPITLFLLAIIIGGMVIAMYLPIFQIGYAIK